MRNNTSKLIKTVLTEQGVGTSTQATDTTIQIQDPLLQMAYNQGCFPDGVGVTTHNNEQVMVVSTAKRIPGYPYAIFRKPAEGQTGGVLEYYKDNKLSNKYGETFTWTCAGLRKLVEDSINQEIINSISLIRQNNPGTEIYSYGDTALDDNKKYDGTCKLVKLDDFIKDRPDLKSVMPKNTQVLVWNCSQVQGGTVQTQANELIRLGFEKCTNEQLAKPETVNIRKVGGISYCKPKVGIGTLEQQRYYQKIKEGVNLIDSNNIKRGCRVLIDNYLLAAKAKAPISQQEIDNYKEYIINCRDNETIKLDRFLSQGISKKLGELRYIQPYTFRDGSKVSYKLSTGVNESTLKNIIRENLIELSKSKKKSLVEEYNIINNRLKIITESGNPKSKKQKEKLVDDIINEMFYLKSQGFNETLINEGFLDIIKSFFGQVPGGIFDTLKERMAQFILDKLGIETDGYLANIFITTMGNIPIGDYVNGKVFNCQYLSNAVSKGVGEGIARKIQKEQGMEGPFYDIIRNSMVEMFTESSFGEKVEKALSQMICPGLPKIKERLNLAGETMKQKALS